MGIDKHRLLIRTDEALNNVGYEYFNMEKVDSAESTNNIITNNNEKDFLINLN